MLKSDISVTKYKTKKRSLIILTAFALFAVYLLFNIFRLDFILYQYYKDKTYDQLTTTSTLRAERGSIYDANLNLLASSSVGWRIFISTKEIKSHIKEDGVRYDEIIARGLSEILSLNYTNLLEKITKSNVLDVTVKKLATEDEYKATVSFIKEKGLEDLVFTEAQSTRIYPEGTLAAHVLGFTGSDNQGLYGLEYSYDDILSGKNGYYLYAKDASGNAMPGEYTTYVPAEDGNSIVTTIDSFVQRALETELEQIRINHDVQNRVTGIVMDTRTGAILAMATSTPFDPNTPFVLDSVSQAKLDASGYAPDSEEYRALRNELLSIMWSNKAVSETYEPGSTFKIVTVSAALDSGAAKPTDTFSCTGALQVGGWRIKCHKTTGHGSGFSLGYGLQMSCNPTMMQIAERVGAERFYRYVEAFGYFEKTGIDLPSEAGTIFHELENIGTTELATASFGQRFKVSIISQLTAIAAVANGGYLVEPYLVQRVVDSEGNTVSEHKPVIKRQVISTSVANEVAKILEEGVSGDGGAKNAYVEGYSVAAKTGTSEKFDILDENGRSYLRIGSTVAFAPSDDSGIAVIIVVDEPQSQVKYGSVVAAPYISAVLSSVLPYLDYVSTAEPSVVTVEDYVGMNVKSAKKLLDEKGVKYRVVGDGNIVLSQSPSAGIDVTASVSTVILYTVDKDSEYCAVPALVGKSLEDANVIATNAGLNIKISNYNPKRNKRLVVTYQSLPPGEYVERGSVIELIAIAMDFED